MEGVTEITGLEVNYLLQYLVVQNYVLIALTVAIWFTIALKRRKGDN